MSRSFRKYPAYDRLMQMAENPVDLTASGVLTPHRINKYVLSSCGFRMMYGTERVNDEVLDGLFSLAEEADAMGWMRKMQEGEVINGIEGYPSENRKVLHTAMRDFFHQQMETTAASEARDMAMRENDKLKTFLAKMDQENRFSDMVVVGIGGSDLGPRALYMAMKAYHQPNRRVHFLSNVDPDDAASIVSSLELSRTLVVVVSKSGTTLETLTNEQIMRRHFVKAGLKPEEHFLAVTGEGSPMDNPSQYLMSFYMWDFVGGRYSATSMVGAVPLAFGMGFEQYWEMLRGASAMDKIALHEEPRKNLPLLSAMLGVWNRNFLKHPTVAILPYSQMLSRFPAHLQQCDMESNGKQVSRFGEKVDWSTGPVIWGEPGTNGQHSFYQLIHQGTDPVPVEFIGFAESQYGEDLEVQGTSSHEKLMANMFAQSMALAVGENSENPNKYFPGNRPNRILLAKKLTPFILGALLSYYENKIAFQGFVWRINSFDQEGVQLGKVLANQFLDLMIERKTQHKAADSFPMGTAMIQLLDGLEMM
ncbi:MAG: glucose-6-phosphate isomerase [Waddliaceae bacterium]|nr:glucose-6-phosphate isomerase [Waddliaceae bacterium]